MDGGDDHLVHRLKNHIAIVEASNPLANRLFCFTECHNFTESHNLLDLDVTRRKISRSIIRMTRDSASCTPLTVSTSFGGRSPLEIIILSQQNLEG